MQSHWFEKRSGKTSVNKQWHVWAKLVTHFDIGSFGSNMQFAMFVSISIFVNIFTIETWRGRAIGSDRLVKWTKFLRYTIKLFEIQLILCYHFALLVSRIIITYYRYILNLCIVHLFYYCAIYIHLKVSHHELVLLKMNLRPHLAPSVLTTGSPRPSNFPDPIWSRHFTVVIYNRRRHIPTMGWQQ